MFAATLLLMGLGLGASVMLAIASKIFYVWEDPRIEQVEDALLGANCGGCGYAGCAAAAEAVVAGKALPDVCVAGGFEIAQNVAAVMGLSVEEKEPEISKPGCYYGFQDADLKYTYSGIMDCRAAMLLYGGSKECHIGCLGLGTCVRACPFDALAMGENNLPVVNEKKCTACGICAEVCPKDIITVTSAVKRILADYKTSECTAPCQRHCPAEIDIPEYIRQILKEDYLGAVRVIKEKNPFPLVCGWLCPAPCEAQCRRNLIDEPVTINALKKYVANYEKETGQRAEYYLPPNSGAKIAIIGGGVEGLTAGYYLRRLGYNAKIFEASEKMGGILRYVILEDRLPKDVLEWDINGILEIGVDTEMGKVMGRDFSLKSLLQDQFDMVLITTGGWDSRQIMRGNIRGESIIPQTQLLLDCLMAGKEFDISEKGNVVICGGGNIAVSAAKKCLEKGCQSITVVFPYSKERAESYSINLQEITNLEGVNVIYSGIPVELSGEGDQLNSISIRTSISNILGEEKIKIIELPLDHLLVGTGGFREMLFVRSQDDSLQWKTIEISRVFHDERERGIFAIAQKGRPTDLTGVVIAVRRGRKIVRAIHLYKSQEEISPEHHVIIPDSFLQDVKDIPDKKDFAVPRKNIDNKMTLAGDELRKEVQRCLACGLICYKRN